jgi:dTDP-glucose pyrophosphorylase
MPLDWKNALICPSTSMRNALVQLGNSRLHILMVIDNQECLMGTLTDGDIRRAILRDEKLDTPVSQIMRTDPLSAPPGISRAAAMRLMKERLVQHLPLLEGKRVVGLITLSDLMEQESERPNWTVLLAGGLGKRLHPLTENLPKPMLPVGGRPILETIIQELAENGLTHIYLSVNYMANVIKAHFGDGSRFGVHIRYLEETQPLGTAGPLTLLPEHHDAPLLVMNGDVLTKVNFAKMLAYHDTCGAHATVGIRQIDVQVPYGVLQLADNKVCDIVEKPVHKFEISAGIYVLDPSVPERMKPGVALDMPELLRQLIGDPAGVVAFPIHEYWIDVGQIPELNRAKDDFQTVFLP